MFIIIRELTFFCVKKSSVNIVKSLINLLENANKWVLRVEERLCNQENALDMSSFSQSSKIVQRLLFELDVLDLVVYLLIYYEKDF
jgi:hypothetical protein